jgi:hypothetical protein
MGYRIQTVPEARGRHLKLFSIGQLIQNDLRKGLSSVPLYLARKGVRLTENLHATKRDIAAVGMAGLLLGMITFLSLAWPSRWAVMGGAVLAAMVYMLVRGDLLSLYWRQGPWFFLKAVGTMFILDLLRGMCVFYSAAKLARQKKVLNR